MTSVAVVQEKDLDDLLPLLRGYIDFYDADVSDEQLLTISRALIADPEREGVQLIARERGGRAMGFATVYWWWTTTRGGRLATMNDLFVHPEARGSGAADALILSSLEQARAHGAVELEWVTAPDNLRAQAVYDRVGGHRSQWITYSLDV